MIERAVSGRDTLPSCGDTRKCSPLIPQGELPFRGGLGKGWTAGLYRVHQDCMRVPVLADTSHCPLLLPAFPALPIRSQQQVLQALGNLA